MALAAAPWGIDGVEISALSMRQTLMAAVFAHDANTLSVRPGVVSGLSATVSGLTVTVGPGVAVCTPQAGANGSYTAAVASNTTQAISARDATYTRWDRIGIQVQDNHVDGSGQTRAQLVYVQGSPSASPSSPSLPTGVVPLWRAVVPIGTAAVTLVDERQWTAAAGGTIPCTSTSRPSGSSLAPGQGIFETDTLVAQLWNGTTWQPFGAAVPTVGVIDANSYTTTITVCVASNSDAASSSNLPVPYAGLLETIQGGGTSEIWQRYSPYGPQFHGVFARTSYMGTWSAWQLLRGMPSTATPHIERSLTSAQNITTGSHVAVLHDHADVTEGGVTYSSGGYTVPIAGLYLMRSAIRFANNDTGSRNAGVYKGATFAGASQINLNGTAVNTTTTGSDMCEVTGVRRLAAGDKIWFTAYQASGADLALSTAESATCAELTWIAP